jgi:hypothetical protein
MKTKSFIRTDNENTLKENVIIHWWNFGKKTLDFNGTIQEYLDKNKVKISIKYYQDQEHNFERSIISAKFQCGQFQEIKFKCHSLEDTVRMIINFNLAYMGDKAQFEFSGRKRTINF